MIVVLLFLLFPNASPKSLPPDIEKCRLADPNLARCLEVKVVDAVKKLSPGNKDIGVVPLEPLFIKKIDLGDPSPGSVSIHQVYENIRFYGITNATISIADVDFSDDNCHWDFTSVTGRVVMEADYTMKGQLLVFPINGHGKCKNTLYDVHSDYKIKCEKYTKKGKKHIRLTDFDFTIKPTRVEFDYENIIDGNEQLSREVVKTVNENSETIYAEVGAAFNEVIVKIWRDTINQVFSRVPQDELFLP